MARRRMRRPSKTTDLEITAFMNLMVILVPFLLMTAVFSHMTILELNLPKADSGEAKKTKPSFNLQVIVRNKTMTVTDGQNVIKTIARENETHNYKILASVLKQVKAAYPDKKAVVIRAEPTIPYDTLITVMDTVRSYHALDDGSIIEAELFPLISIGDAPKS